jgi:hypothetical protein
MGRRAEEKNRLLIKAGADISRDEKLGEQPKVVSTQLITCQLMCMEHSMDDPPVQALLIVYTDGHVEVRCPINQGPRDISKWADPLKYIECGYEKRL